MPADKPHHLPPEPIEMVAIDLDGTLLRNDKRLSKRTVEMVQQVKQRGIRVVIASARPPRSVREIYTLLNLDTMEINYNGALIHHPIHQQVIYHRPLPVPLGKQVVELARRVNPRVVVSVEILDKWYTDKVDHSLPTETSKHFEPDFVGPLAEFLNRPLTKLMLLSPPDELAPVREAVTREFAGQIKLAVSDEHLIQVMHPAVDKSAALIQAAEHYEVPSRRVMAIGDAPNDVGMLQWAGFGVAVENAWRETLEVADAVVPSNDDEGVAVALERYCLS